MSPPPPSKSKPTSATSVKSSSSQASVDSVGIGAAKQTPRADAQLRFRLLPQGIGTNVRNAYDQNVFDCVVFVIYCEKHQTVALTSSSSSDSSRLFSYFPFIPLQDTFTLARMSRDGLAIILGRNDSTADVDQTMATLPDCSTNWLNIFRVQMPQDGNFYSRYTQLVHIPKQGSSEFKCCQSNSRIQWAKLSDVTARHKTVNDLWGDEVIAMCRAISSNERVFLSELDLKTCVPTGQAQRKLLEHLKWSERRVHQLLEDFIKHMYPAIHMTANSFRCFLQKYAQPKANFKAFDRLFKAFAAGSEFVTFGQLLIGIACMDPKATNDLEARVKFIFQ